MKTQFAAILVFTTLVSGCSTRLIESISTTKDYSNLYLRGVFTWWEAEESFKLQAMGGEVYGVSTKLIADGQPYDFKFADANWTPGYSCGAVSGNKKSLALGQSLPANCESEQSASFQFIPAETAEYTFYIDFSSAFGPVVHIEKL